MIYTFEKYQQTRGYMLKTALLPIIILLCIYQGNLISQEVLEPNNPPLLRFDAPEIHYFELFPEWEQPHAVMFYSTNDEDRVLCVAYNADGDIVRQKTYSMSDMQLLKEYIGEYTPLSFQCRLRREQNYIYDSYTSVFRHDMMREPEIFEPATVTLYWMKDDHSIDTVTGICMYVNDSKIVIHPDVKDYNPHKLETYNWDRILHIEYDEESTYVSRVVFPSLVYGGTALFLSYMLMRPSRDSKQRYAYYPVYFGSAIFLSSMILFSSVTGSKEIESHDNSKDTEQNQYADAIKELTKQHFFSRGLPPEEQ